MTKKRVDWIIIGAGIFGLYASIILGRRKQKVIVLEKEATAFTQASFINQARVHNGYHYPRSYSTAEKTQEYFRKFADEFNFAINKSFKKIYAIARNQSYVSAADFQRFCSNVGIKCDEVDLGDLMNPTEIEASFEVEEYAFDAKLVSNNLLAEIERLDGVQVKYNSEVVLAEKETDHYKVKTKADDTFRSANVINASYANINKLNIMFGYKPLPIKFEVCELDICQPPKQLKNYGVTVMDGPFFSCMPFGHTGYHTLSSVTYTPHTAARDHNFPQAYPILEKDIEKRSHWREMLQVAKKYVPVIEKAKLIKPMYTIKSVLDNSEVDDSRPTLIKKYSQNPGYYVVFSGKINTIYDLHSILNL
jgi:glycine/D-amino acid oxidase-like deaminating enzyme